MTEKFIERFCYHPEQIPFLEHMLHETFKGRVQHGPFRDMRIEHKIIWPDANFTTKLLGSYEFELHDVVRKAIDRCPDTIVNAGCAEGYYSVGFARLLPYTQIFAMDIDTRCLAQCERNAAINGVIKLVTVQGMVGPQDLKIGEGKKLYVIDIEGYECSVLNPELCPDLLNSDMIIECHDFLYCDVHEDLSIISDELQRRFAATHDVERIEPQLPHMRDYPCLSGMQLGSALMAVTEKRPYPTSWLACWAKERSN